MPVLGDHFSPGGPKQMAQDERGHHRVVERTQDRNELGDEVDRRGDPRRTEEEKGLGPSRHTRLTDQALEQPEEARQQGRHLPRGGTSAP